MLTLFSGHHIHVGTAAWHFHTGLCKFLCNLSMNIWSLRKCSHLKLREVSSLCIFYTVQLRYKRTTHIRIIWAYFAYTCMSIHAHIRVYTHMYTYMSLFYAFQKVYLCEALLVKQRKHISWEWKCFKAKFAYC